MDRASRAALAVIGVALIALTVVAAHRPDGATRITVLDVGQGDAILVEGGRGARLVIDGGPDPTRLLIALGEHLPPWDRRIDAVVLTHPHEDHVAGLAALLSRYQVARVFEPGMIGPGPGYAAWAASLAAGGPTRWALATGDRLAVDDVELQVLWPNTGSVPLHPSDSGTSINNVSIVLLGRVGDHAFLLAGDVEQGIDPTLLTRSLPHLDLLKVAHHGSGTASTQAFLNAVQPKVAIVSVGAGNPYGHPAPATMARLRGVARQVYRTDKDGSVTVTFDGPAERVRASGGRTASGVATPPDARFATSVGDAAGASADRSADGSPTRQAAIGLFACSVPPELGPVAVEAVPVVVPPTDAGPVRHPPDPARARWGGGYHRRDDGPVPGGGGPAAPVPRPPGVAPPAFARRGRGCRLAGSSDRRARPVRSGPRRGGRAPP